MSTEDTIAATRTDEVIYLGHDELEKAFEIVNRYLGYLREESSKAEPISAPGSRQRLLEAIAYIKTEVLRWRATSEYITLEEVLKVAWCYPDLNEPGFLTEFTDFREEALQNLVEEYTEAEKRQHQKDDAATRKFNRYLAIILVAGATGVGIARWIFGPFG